MNNNEFFDELYNSITEEEINELNINLEDEQFKVISQEQANFFLRQIAKLNEDKEEINNSCNNMIESYVSKVNNFREKEITSIDSTIEYFTRLLESFAEDYLKEHKGKSVKLPFGTLQFRKTQPSYSYSEEKDIISFLKTAPNMDKFVAVTTKESIDKKSLKAEATIKDGAMFIGETRIPNVEVTPAGEKFSINLPK